MIACYDLARCPPTYDAVAFLALAELERKRRGEEHLDIRILPGPVGGFRRDTLWPRTIEERVQLRDRVLVPLCRLLPSVQSVTVDRDRTAALAAAEQHSGVGADWPWGTGEYFVGLPRIVEALRAGSRPLRADRPEPLARVLDAPYVTFTLREAEHHPLRNSRLEEWIRAVAALTARSVNIVVVWDSVHVSTPFDPAVYTHRSASTDLAVRAALYAAAALNVGISNGPMWMSIFMDAPTLMLRPTTNAAGGCYDDAFYAKCGIRRDDQLPTSPAHQRLVWEEDTCESIVRAVEEMVEVVV